MRRIFEKNPPRNDKALKNTVIAKPVRTLAVAIRNLFWDGLPRAMNGPRNDKNFEGAAVNPPNKCLQFAENCATMDTGVDFYAKNHR